MTDPIKSLLSRIEAAEVKLIALEAKANDPVERVKRELARKSVYSARFYTVPSHYYDLSLDERAELLSCSVPQLCKSIIFENTMHDPSIVDPLANSKYYCVITQYKGRQNN
jgi:hypothetical protein